MLGPETDAKGEDASWVYPSLACLNPSPPSPGSVVWGTLPHPLETQ